MRGRFPLALCFIGAALLLITASLAQAQEPVIASVDTVYVALPTGDTETDRANVQAAFDAVQRAGTVQFAPGTYLLGAGARLTVPDVAVLGHPEGTVLRGCDPADFDTKERLAVVFECTGLYVQTERQTIRGLTFEYAWHGIVVGPFPSSAEEARAAAEGEVQLPDYPAGGQRIEGNTFRASPNGIRVLGTGEGVSVVRDNDFVDVFHAIGIYGAPLHFLGNRVRVEEPSRVPNSRHPGSAIIVSSRRSDCSGHVVAGNHIEGYPGAVYVLANRGQTCRGVEVHGNTIEARRVRVPEAWGGATPTPEDSTMVGVPITLMSIDFSEPGSETEAEGVVEEVVVEKNRVLGAEGLGILVDGSRNRISGNTLTGIQRREPFPGITWIGAEHTTWEAANGSAIWISPGSDGNEVVGNIFEDIAADAVVLEGDSNRVELRSASDSVRDLGSGNRVWSSTDYSAYPAASSDTVHVAPPTGETEIDRANVQAAFDAVQPGGTVIFAAGSYVIGGEGLVLRTPGVALRGDSDGTTFLGCTRKQRRSLGADEFSEVCGDGFVLAAEAQRVSGLRFESFSLALSIQEATEVEAQGRTASFTGGHVVEDNSFHDGFSFRIALDADSTVRVRRNVFRNVWHAVAIGGRNIQVTNNDISVPEPERVPFGFAGVAIGIRPLGDDGACSSMVVAGNRIDGHTEAVAIAVFPQDPPGSVCSDITVRDNEIVMRPVRMPDDQLVEIGRSDLVERSDLAGALAIAPAIRLYNAQRLVSEGLIERWTPWMPEGGWPDAMSEGRISNVRVENNRITGAVGVAIEAAHVTDSRIVDNEIEVRPATTRREQEGLTVGGNGGPGVWVLMGLVDEVNGMPVWVSAGSEGTVVRLPAGKGIESGGGQN